MPGTDISLDFSLLFRVFARMKYIRNWMFFVVVMIIAGSCARHRLPYIFPEMEQRDSSLDSLFLPEASYGILVQNESGDTLLSYNADKLMVPASTLKLVIASAAWKFLGSGYRMPTYIGYEGFTNKGILFGNLVITGTGDPTLNNRYWQSPQAIFSNWADSLKAHGIREIRGDIIGNDDLFEDVHLGAGWAWDDLSFSYAAEFGPLMADNTTAEFFINPPIDFEEDISIMDNLPFRYFTYKSEVSFDDSLDEHIHARRVNGTNIFRAYGNYGKDKKSYYKLITAENPTLFYTEILKSALERSGITISGKARDIDELQEKPQEITSVFRHYSPQLSQIIGQFLQYSNNQAGEALLRHLAWKETGFGAFSNAMLVLSVFLDNIGINATEYRIADASGLSRYNLISPAALNKILLYMNSEEEFIGCLSRPGWDGTLARREGLRAMQLKAKTGSMSRIDCASGYITTQRGEILIFTVMINNYSPRAGQNQPADSIIRMINNF
jgi:serine-type D-Ala-D-Ala carboxypeptidase/endopeptidase (penicillin-binding protein 4)